MPNYSDVVKIAVDGLHGTVQKYSVAQSQDLIREALIEANGGNTTFDLKRAREHPEMFALIEELLSATVVDTLDNDPLIQALVDMRNVRTGDKNEFLVEDGDLFLVSRAADGIRDVRRQRLFGPTKVTIPTEFRHVTIYEELSRVMSGMIDFNAMIDRVGISFRRQLQDDVYALWSGVTKEQLGGQTFFPTAGSYDTDTLLDLIEHVEAAANGAPATLLATKKGARKLDITALGDQAKDDMYAMGYVGQFYGTPVVALPQRHVIGTNNFVYKDNEYLIVAGPNKPVKLVYEGDPLVILGNPINNADLTQDFNYMERYGLGIVTAGTNAGIGKYTTT